MNPRVIILSGDGINCEHETARAFKAAGGDPILVHVNSLLKNPQQIFDSKIFCLPGGFSFGDELKSGKILAEKLRQTLLSHWLEFTRLGGLTLGICNGFQILIQLGAFEHLSEGSKRQVTLSVNDHGRFLNRWVECCLTEEALRSPWLKNIHPHLFLPIRHKEGRVETSPSSEIQRSIPLQYAQDVNGSFHRAAALMDSTGRVLGMMPHPEAGIHSFLNPLQMPPEEKERNANQLLQIFRNAVTYEN